MLAVAVLFHFEIRIFCVLKFSNGCFSGKVFKTVGSRLVRVSTNVPPCAFFPCFCLPVYLDLIWTVTDPSSI